QCAAHINKLNAKRVLLLCDPGVIQLGFHQDVFDSLQAAHYELAVFDGIQPDPTDKNIIAGVQAVHDHQAEVIIAVGGGSVMDAAKVIALAAVHGVNLAPWMGIENVPGAGLPLVCIPTTAGTGSEATKVAVITDTERNIKMMMLSQYLLPQISIVDFELSMSMPPALTAAVGVDTLTHGLEAYVSRKANALTDPIALSCIQLSAKFLKRAWTDGSDREAREAMQLAACQGGMAFANSSVALVHGMSRPIGAYFHLPHGLSNAVLLPTITQWSLSAASERYAHVARLISCAESNDSDIIAGEKLVDYLFQLNYSLEIPRLGESIDQEKEDYDRLITTMATDAIASGSPGNNPRIPEVAEVESLYNQAW
ncbi:MAG: iron-containing alcohol dehydrogenase, partial [Planctomycetes bacterium]|nr:iron-containing alcohol dehydrogenase [Planctomycetota bacterium]